MKMDTPDTPDTLEKWQKGVEIKSTNQREHHAE